MKDEQLKKLVDSFPKPKNGRIVATPKSAKEIERILKWFGYRAVCRKEFDSQ